MNEDRQKDLKLLCVLIILVLVVVVIYKSVLFYSQSTLKEPKQDKGSITAGGDSIETGIGYRGIQKQFSEREMKKLRKSAESISKLFKEQHEKMIQKGAD